MIAPDQVTLYRVRRPDGTVIEAEPSTNVEEAFNFANPDRREDGLLYFVSVMTGYAPVRVTYVPLSALEAAQARIAEIEIATLEKAAGLCCDYCARNETPRKRSVIGEKNKLYMHGRQFCLATKIHAEIARLRAEVGEEG